MMCFESIFEFTLDCLSAALFNVCSIDRCAGFNAIKTCKNVAAVCMMGCLHDPANVQQTFSKCIQNTRANAGRLLPYVIINEPAGCLLKVC